MELCTVHVHLYSAHAKHTWQNGRLHQWRVKIRDQTWTLHTVHTNKVSRTLREGRTLASCLHVVHVVHTFWTWLHVHHVWLCVSVCMCMYMVYMERQGRCIKMLEHALCACACTCTANRIKRNMAKTRPTSYKGWLLKVHTNSFWTDLNLDMDSNRKYFRLEVMQPFHGVQLATNGDHSSNNTTCRSMTLPVLGDEISRCEFLHEIPSDTPCFYLCMSS